MSYSTAGNRLKKMLFFKLVQETKKDRCFRCDEKITNYIELSIDHMDAWLDQDNSVFWNLNNIAYSHLTCNSAKSARFQNSEGIQQSFRVYLTKFVDKNRKFQ